MDNHNYEEVVINNKSYGEFNGVTFYVDKRLPKNDFDYLTSPKGKQGFRFGKHLYELLKQQMGGNFSIYLTTQSSKIIEHNGSKSIFINYGIYSKIAQNEFIYVRRDAGLSSASRFLKNYLGLNVAVDKVITKSQATKFTKNIGNIVQKIKKSEQNEFGNKLLELIKKKKIKLTDEVLKNLSAATKQSIYEKQLEKLSKKVESNFKNKNIKKKWENNFYKPWFKKNYWVFGIEYQNILSKTQITSRQNVDLLLETYDGYLEIIEVKTPNVELFSYDKSHNNYYPSNELSSAINQAMFYIHKMELQQQTIKTDIQEEEEGETASVLKPRCKIVIGYRRYWSKEKSNIRKKKNDTLRLLNDSLPNIDIFTFDDILKMGNLMLKRYGKRIS